jgi:hypothetical protein
MQGPRRLRLRSYCNSVPNPSFGFPKAPGGLQPGFHTVRRSARILAPSFPDACLIADLLIAEVSFSAGASEIISFDNVFGRHPRVRRLR